MFFKIRVLKKFAIFTKKHQKHSFFPVSIAKFLITAFLQNTFGGFFQSYNVITKLHSYQTFLNEMITHILMSWFKTLESKRKTQKAQKDEKLVFKKKLQKMQTKLTLIKQNNDHARIMRKIRFRSSFNVLVKIIKMK